MTSPAAVITIRLVSSRPVAALWRLRPYLRPYRFQLIAMIVAALAAEGAEVAIPLLVKSVIDGAIAIITLRSRPSIKTMTNGGNAGAA